MIDFSTLALLGKGLFTPFCKLDLGYMCVLQANLSMRANTRIARFAAALSNFPFCS